MNSSTAAACQKSAHEASMKAYNAYLLKRQLFIDDLEKLFNLALEAQDFKAALKAKEFIGKTLRFFWASRTDKTPCPHPSPRTSSQPYPTEPHLAPPIISSPSPNTSQDTSSSHTSCAMHSHAVSSSPLPSPRNRAERRRAEKMERQKMKNNGNT